MQLLAPSRTTTTAAAVDDNARFMTDETQRQQQIMQAQDQSVDGLLTSVQGLNHVAVQISHEVKDQNKCVRQSDAPRTTGPGPTANVVCPCQCVRRMLDELNQDVEQAQERMNFVMDKMSKMLKTKGAPPLAPLGLPRSPPRAHALPCLCPQTAASSDSSSSSRSCSWP